MNGSLGTDLVAFIRVGVEQNALTLPARKLSLDSLLSGLIFGLPTACRFYGPLKPSADSLADRAALELGKGACNLKHQPFGRRSRIDRLLIEVQISRSPRPSQRQTGAFGRLSASRPGQTSHLAPLHRLFQRRGTP
jgi:hypothetical protein